MGKKLIHAHAHNWLDDFQQHVAKLATSHPHAQVYGLIDCAFSEKCYRTLKQHRHALQYRSLFDLSCDMDESLAAVSPTLIPLQHDTVTAWRAVLRQTNGMPMVSLIVTPESLDALALRLKAWCVVDADGEKYCFRFSDTRRLPDIVTVLTQQQHGEFFGPALAWSYRTRTAQWANLNLPMTTHSPADEVHLNSEQCAFLIAASTADEIIADLGVREPALTQSISAAHAHDAVSNALVQANQGGINEQDFYSWCSLWLRIPALKHLPQLSQWLDEHRTGKRNFEDLTTALQSQALRA